jgi:NAD(P)-dependent dehydrogenase (short-subunit alcohol dehydrogenase family)
VTRDALPPLAGRLALVTGASRGIGLAVADELRAAGAHVVRLARSLDDAEGDRDTTVRCDLSVPAEVDRVLANVVRERGVPDIVVNNAGVFFSKPFMDTSAREFAQSLTVNLTAPFLVIRALTPHMIKRRSGHIVTIGSVSDHVAFPGSAAYAASKFGVRGVHEVLRVEVEGSGVRTTLVSPGPVDTDMWDAVDPDHTPGFTKRAQMMRPEDVADAVLFAVTRPLRVDVTEMRLMPSRATPSD